MYVVYGSDAAEKASEQFFVMELNTISNGTNEITAYAVVPVDEIPADKLKEAIDNVRLHEYLVEQLRAGRLVAAKEIAEGLKGFWPAFMDDHYDYVIERITNTAAQDWNYTVKVPMLDETEN